MRLRHKSAWLIALLATTFGMTVAIDALSSPSQAEVSFDACTDITDSPPVQDVELVAQLTEGDRTFGLFRVIDGGPGSTYAVQSVDSSGECRIDHWNPTGQPILITDSETIPPDIAEELTEIMVQDRQR